jgi:hypothetical protein
LWLWWSKIIFGVKEKKALRNKSDDFAKVVTPVKTGVQGIRNWFLVFLRDDVWIPAFAGMTF